jgi:hypothetical protein
VATAVRPISVRGMLHVLAVPIMLLLVLEALGVVLLITL